MLTDENIFKHSRAARDKRKNNSPIKEFKLFSHPLSIGWAARQFSAQANIFFFALINLWAMLLNSQSLCKIVYIYLKKIIAAQVGLLMLVVAVFFHVSAEQRYDDDDDGGTVGRSSQTVDGHVGREMR